MIIGIQGTLGQGKTTALVAFSLDYKTKTGLPIYSKWQFRLSSPRFGRQREATTFLQGYAITPNGWAFPGSRSRAPLSHRAVVGARERYNPC